ncbi:hypothetical protein ACWC9T_24275 [Kitasatospora sp. NPDC001159]
MVNTHKTATGSGVSNQDNGLAVAGNGGNVGALQGNGDFDARVYYPHVPHSPTRTG